MNPQVISFAIQAHHNVNHLYDGHPYSIHLGMVVSVAYEFIGNGVHIENPDLIISACWLHDTIEDCRCTYNDIKKVAGEEVADIVYALTNEKGKNRKERANEKYYEGIRNTPGATFVKMCDRIANIRYSISQKSEMFEVYKKESPAFIRSLFQTLQAELPLRKMIEVLQELIYPDPFPFRPH